MTILQANLKHLYQRRAFWLLGVFLVIFALLMVMAIVDAKVGREDGAFAIPADTDGAFALPAYWMLIVGMFLAAQCMDVLTKPFAYCLPGHKPVPRKVLFYVGWSLSILWSFIFFMYPGVRFGETFLACVSAFFMFPLPYWLGVWCVSKWRSWCAGIGFIPLLIIGGSLMDLHLRIEYLIIHHWLWMLLFGSMANVLAWIHWGRTDLARQYCGTLWMGAFDMWNKEKMAKFGKARLAKIPTGISPGVEDFFVSRISKCHGRNLERYIWGSLYKSFGMLLSPRRQGCVWLLIIWFPLLMYLGYMGPGSNILLFMPCIMVVHMGSPVRSNMLICGGRRERFWSAIVLAISAAVLVTTLTTVCGLLSLLWEPVMPDLPIKGMTFEYRAIDVWSCFFAPLLIVPISLTFGLFMHKLKAFGLVAMIVILSVLFVAVRAVYRERFITVIPVLVIIALLCCWAAFVSILHHICMKRSLVQ